MFVYQITDIRDCMACPGLGTPIKILLRCHILLNANMITLIEGLTTCRDFMTILSSLSLQNCSFVLFFFPLSVTGRGEMQLFRKDFVHFNKI